MKYISLNPDQIITLKDYPLYNQTILQIYFRIFSKNQGEVLPPSPVVHISSGIPFATDNSVVAKNYNTKLKNFLNNNPNACYFLLDGSHKTTAATLSRKMIPVMALEEDQDFEVARKLIETGELFGWYEVGNSLKEAIEKLAKHHIYSKKFLTVEEKTNLLVQNKNIPEYIISSYKKNAR